MENKKQLETILKKNGFSGIKKYLRCTDKNHIFLSNKDNVLYFIKLTLNPKQFDNLINEVKANNFINKIKPSGLSIYIPKSELAQEATYTMAIFEYLPGNSLANQDTLTIKKLSITDIEKIFQIVKFYLEIPKSKVPKYFITKSKKLTIKNYQSKMNDYLAEPLGRLITKKEKQQLIDNLNSNKIKHTFQHHDFVLWNMFKNKRGEIALIDAEFSRWGMRWYDLAYFFIQTYTYLQQPEFAIKSLRYFIKRFKEEFPKMNIEQEILLPMYYRITANLNEALGNKKMEKLTRKLLEKILTNDLSKILE